MEAEFAAPLEPPLGAICSPTESTSIGLIQETATPSSRAASWPASACSRMLLAQKGPNCPVRSLRCPAFAPWVAVELLQGTYAAGRTAWHVPGRGAPPKQGPHHNVVGHWPPGLSSLQQPATSGSTCSPYSYKQRHWRSTAMKQPIPLATSLIHLADIGPPVVPSYCTWLMRPCQVGHGALLSQKLDQHGTFHSFFFKQ
jgi:hypothetical protein